MTKKDYVKLADMVAGFRQKDASIVSLDDLTETLVRILMNDSYRFNANRFRLACDPDGIGENNNQRPVKIDYT